MERRVRSGLWTSCVLGMAVLGTGCESEAPSVPRSTSAESASEKTPATDPHAGLPLDPHTGMPLNPNADPHAGLNIPEKKVDDGPLDTEGGELALDEVTFTAPAGWGRKPARGGFVDAEYVLPKAEPELADGRLTISRAGGDIEANIDRWRGQFGGKPEKETRSEIDVEGLKVVIVDMSGEFADQRGPFAPPTKRAGYRMFAAILPIGAQSHFVKATGPEKTIEAHVEALTAFVKSAKPKK